MNHSADNSDIDRLEARAKESYNFIATELANYNCIQSLICLKNFIGEMRSQGGTVFTFRGQQMGYHVFPFFIDLIIRYCTVFQPTRQFDYDTINFLIVRHEEFPEILQQPNGTMNLDKNVPEWLIRASFGQLVAQEMKRTLSSRMLYFYQEIPKLYKLRHETFQNIVKKVFEVQFRISSLQTWDV